MMTITVHLHTTLQRRTARGPVRRLDLALPPGSTLAELLSQLDVRSDDETVLFVVNGRQAGPGYVLRDGDEVNLIPAISGGVA